MTEQGQHYGESGPANTADDLGHHHDGECEDAVTKLYEYLDGELDRDLMDRLQEHLRRCSPCLEAFDFHAELRRVVRSKCAETMPEDVRAKIAELIDACDAEESRG